MSKVASFVLPMMLITFFCILVTCGGDSGPTVSSGAADGNQAPKINSISSSHTTVSIDYQATFSCQAADPDGDELEYTWSAGGGSFPFGTETPSVKWKAPLSAGECRITVSVSDGYKAVSASLMVNVIAEQCAGLDGYVYTGYSPLEGVGDALVALQSVSQRTAVTGYYKFNYVVAGTTQVHISADGYHDLIKTIVIKPGKNSRDFKLYPIY